MIGKFFRSLRNGRFFRGKKDLETTLRNKGRVPDRSNLFNGKSRKIDLRNISPDYNLGTRNTKPENLEHRSNGDKSDRDTSNREVSTIQLKYTKPDFYRAASRLSANNGDLETGVYDIMQKFVFNDNDFEYGGIDKIGDITTYFNGLSAVSKGKSKQALESAKTVLSHLEDYLSIDKSGRKGSFKKYLFGENGKLTQRRLDDMRSIVSKANKLKRDGSIVENENYRFNKGDKSNRGFNIFNVSYKEHAGSDKILVNINDKDSKGMETEYGRIHWDSFDKMFGGKVDTRKSVTKYVNNQLENQVERGNAENIEGYTLLHRELYLA